jgi:serine/threonine protein kinase
MRGLNYIHKKGICHRDIKPQNLLVDPTCHILKICDLGSAKRLIDGEKSTAYMCTRFYRAPELLLGCTTYTNAIDMWAAGCVVAEMINGKIFFEGTNAANQF